MIFTTHLSSSQALQVTGSLSVTGSKGVLGATGITFKSSALRNSGSFENTGSVNIYGDVNLTGSLLVNGAEIEGGGNYQTLQAAAEIEAGFNQFYLGPVTIPDGLKITIQDTGNLKIIDIEDLS